MARHPGTCAAALSHRGRGTSLQHPPEAELHRRDLPAPAADGPDWPDYVARDGRGLAVAAGSVRRPTVSTLDPLHLRHAASGLHPRPLDDGAARGADQRDPIDDHRPVPRAAGQERRGMIDRRRFIATGASGLLLGGCDRLNNSPEFRGVLRSAEKLTMASQRLISPRDALAREFGEADLSPIFRSNGTSRPGTAEYARHAAEQFANWRLEVSGLVAHPLSIPVQTLRSLPHRTQITRHDCVEGWSAIGKWHGVQLWRILDHAGLSTRAKYIVFHCADRFGTKPYYESIDLSDAFHPQTMIARRMNGHLL